LAPEAESLSPHLRVSIHTPHHHHTIITTPSPHHHHHHTITTPSPHHYTQPQLMASPPSVPLATFEAEELLKLLESELGSTESVMEGFSTTVKSSGALRKLTTSEVIRAMHNGPNVICLDARTPKEYAVGHIPGAYNLPLFSDEERVTIGTLFKDAGRGRALTAGMDVVRPKLASLVQRAKEFMTLHAARQNVESGDGSSCSCSRSSSSSRRAGTKSTTHSVTTADAAPPTVIVHCWRGGMRSHALAYLLQTRTSFHVALLIGGYKAFRYWARMLYCYLPVNASYECAHSSTPTGKRKRDLQRLKKKSKKAHIKKQAKLSTLTNEGLEKRRIALEKREQELQEQDRKESERKMVEEQAAKHQWSLTFDEGPEIVIVGGRSGSGKTRVLLALRDQLGQQVIDLEGLAHHNGSAFGFVGHGAQPTNQQFGNNVAVEWFRLDSSRKCLVCCVGVDDDRGRRGHSLTLSFPPFPSLSLPFSHTPSPPFPPIQVLCSLRMKGLVLVKYRLPLVCIVECGQPQRYYV
jgi:tRNA 2-selenouridine synthase SelU